MCSAPQGRPVPAHCVPLLHAWGAWVVCAWRGLQVPAPTGVGLWGARAGLRVVSMRRMAYGMLVQSPWCQQHWDVHAAAPWCVPTSREQKQCQPWQKMTGVGVCGSNSTTGLAADISSRTSSGRQQHWQLISAVMAAAQRQRRLTSAARAAQDERQLVSAAVAACIRSSGSSTGVAAGTSSSAGCLSRCSAETWSRCAGALTAKTAGPLVTAVCGRRQQQDPGLGWTACSRLVAKYQGSSAVQCSKVGASWMGRRV